MAAPPLVWVTVDDEAQPARTLTAAPATLASGLTSVADAPPHDLTASLYTWTRYGEIFTSAGPPPNPTATNPASAQGAFVRCRNLDGPAAPFCRPAANSTLLTGTTYYVTWDPDFYNRTSSNGSQIAVRLEYLNRSDDRMVHLETYNRVPSAWGFWPFRVQPSLLRAGSPTNITITLLSSPYGSDLKNRSLALPAVLAYPDLDHTSPTLPPTGSTLKIALPLSLGLVFLLVVGLCLWNRKTRRIQIGNVMSRARHGYDGRRHRRHRRRHHDGLMSLPGNDEDAIPLDNATARSPPPHYSDAPAEPWDRSTAFEQQDTTGGSRNAFRDELRRQEAERLP